MKRIVCGLFLICASSFVQAGTVEGKVLQLFSDYPNFGWCMAKVSFPPEDEPTCSNFISFGCDGEYVPKSVANANFANIQLALVTDATVKVGVRSDLRYNENYCLGQRVDILPLPNTP